VRQEDIAMKWATGRNALLAFVLTFVLLGVNACLLYRATLVLVDNDRRLARSYEVLASLGNTLSALNEAQAGERGYVLTGDDTFLGSYDQAAARLRDELTRLQSLAAEEARDGERVAELDQRVAAELDTLDRVIRVRREDSFEAAREMVARGGGRRMADVRRCALELADGERRLLQDRADAARGSTRRALVTLGLSTLLALACLGLCACVVWRSLRARTRVEDSLMETARRKDEFLAALGHELRNPLAAMLHAAEFLRERPGDHPASGRAREVLEWQVRYVARLVEDLLDVARIDRDMIRLHRQACELAPLLARAVDIARPLVEARRHQLIVATSDEPTWLDADPARLVQVLANLLSNAARYTEAGGTIRLTAGREGAEVVVRVRDNGVGIAAEMLPRVFDAFTRLDQRPAGSSGGLGLGLTLARRLAELHGGSVEAYSDGLGKGSVFAVRLPALTRSPTRPVDSDVHPAAADRVGLRRVLVVDDNVEAAAMLAALLEIKGHQVWVVGDGPAALEVALTYRPDVVLLDIGLPGMDGYEVARRLNEGSAAAEGVLLVALTGYGQPDDHRRSREAGFHHHLVKPVDLELLEELLARPGERATKHSRGCV
jgi:signal transduction histidine kinase/ActR/RegA family two-component response regulator